MSRLPLQPHHHPEYWTERDQERFEDRVTQELHDLRADVGRIGNRLTLIFGGLSVMIFLLPILAPLLRGILGLPQ